MSKTRKSIGVLARDKSIENRIKRIERTIGRAQAYLERGENIEGSAWLHFDDWKGNSGHPDWVEHKLIPSLYKMRAEAERNLRDWGRKQKDKMITRRRNEVHF